MAYPRQTRTKVTPNAKLESFNIQTFNYDGTEDTNGATWTPAEGDPIAFSYTRSGFATKPVGAADASVAFAAPTAAGAHVVYINFVAADRSDVAHSQADVLDNKALTGVTVQAGGLAGIRGTINIGLSASCWYANDGTGQGTMPTVGHGVFITASGKWTAEALGVGKFYYGIVERVWDGQAYFTFHSVPFLSGETQA